MKERNHKAYGQFPKNIDINIKGFNNLFLDEIVHLN